MPKLRWNPPGKKKPRNNQEFGIGNKGKGTAAPFLYPYSHDCEMKMKKLSPNLVIALFAAALAMTSCYPGVTVEPTAAPVVTTESITAPGATTEPETETAAAAIQFTDDMGNEINLEHACQRMIVLYSAHTENLYSLGVGDSVIGVNSTSIYPPDAATKPVFDYDSDPEKVIAANPDCMLIRPFIDRKNPDFVAAVKKAGVTVISLYPEKFNEFDAYIQKLGLMTDTQEKADELLKEFHQNLAAISEKTAAIEPKKTVFFESTAVNCRTVTADSMAAQALKLAGGINLAADAEAMTEGSSIASYGVEKILMNADKIDVYITQRGAMNAGDNAHSISIREGFDSVKAVRDGRILEINEKLISAPTFRFYKGVYEIARYLYPDVMDDLESFRSDEPITRENLAAILVRFAHKPIYVTASSKYYQQEHSGHTYGLFTDVAWDDPSFDVIETAVLAGWIEGKTNQTGEFFDKAGSVTRDDFAKAVFLLGDYERTESHTPIADLDQVQNPKIVQILVDNGVFQLEDGKFNPTKQLTVNEVIDLLNGLNP
jgi:iron complex transport system substrate-binding protein